MIPEPGQVLPDVELVDQDGTARSLSALQEPSEADRRYGFPGPLLVVMTGRGWFCPRDQAHLRSLVPHAREFALNQVVLVYIAIQGHREQAAFRSGLNAPWRFLSDPDRTAVTAWGLMDDTEGEEAEVFRPHAFVCDPERIIRRVYDGWWLAGRPSADDLRRDIREIRPELSGGQYADWTDPDVMSIRVPQRVWRDDEEPLGEIVRRDVAGTITRFDRSSGSGWVQLDGEDEPVFFNFTAIPGEGYRTLRPGAEVIADLLTHPRGAAATNVRPA